MTAPRVGAGLLVGSVCQRPDQAPDSGRRVLRVAPCGRRPRPHDRPPGDLCPSLRTIPTDSASCRLTGTIEPHSSIGLGADESGEAGLVRQHFPGYYRPTADEFRKLWGEGLVILDANVLLNLYRYSEATRNELLSVLQTVRDRLWLPHQAGLEYERNRLKVMKDQARAYGRLRESVDNTEKQLNVQFQTFARHPVLNPKDVTSVLDMAFDSIRKYLSEQEAVHPSFIQNGDALDGDIIRNTLNPLYEGRVGDAYPAKRLNEIYELGRVRYQDEIPPGFKDQSKTGNEQYGDLVLWLQIIEKGKATRLPILLITDDGKDDWWLRIDGETISPHPLLVEEMSREASILFYAYQSDRFLSASAQYLQSSVSPQSIQEVQRVRESDEQQAATTEPRSWPLLRHRLPDPELASALQVFLRSEGGADAIQRAMHIRNQESDALARAIDQLGVSKVRESGALQDWLRTLTALDVLGIQARLDANKPGWQLAAEELDVDEGQSS